MGRLIDADELENMTFSQGYNHDGVVYVPLLEVRQNIRKAKTAYDVDKVVAELEEERMRYFLTIANTGDASLDIAYKEVSGAIEKAIDIVKRGGVE